MTQTHSVPPVDLLQRVWADLCSSPSRFMGTPGAERSLDILERYLAELGFSPQVHSFMYPGWKAGSAINLTIANQHVEAYPMLGSSGTDSTAQEIQGRLHYVGPFGIWGTYDWQRFALFNEQGALQAYILGREYGEAIPQALPEGIDTMPYIGIGKNTVENLFREAAKDQPITCRLRCDAAGLDTQEGINLSVDLPKLGSRSVLIGAHYDSLFSTPGAYDNASGAACLVALAAAFRGGVPDLNVRLVWFGAEEWLLAGSKAYALHLQQSGSLPYFVLNLDGIGRGDQLDIWYGPDNLLPDLRHIIEPIAVREGVKPVYVFPPPAGSDHAPFYDAGCPVCMLTFNDLQILHRPEDVIEENKLHNMYRTLAIIREFLTASGPMLQRHTPNKQDA